jgi:hypothetical protein
MEEVKHERCGKCKCWRLPSDFLNDKGRKLKTCDKCRALCRKSEKKCPHGKRKNRCKDCGGVSICLHMREKSTCRDCKGSSFCTHGRIKTQCKDCGGSSFCPHGKRKDHCVECTGCPHGKRKSQCKDCGGSSFCSHGRDKSTCKECKGSRICPHGKFKVDCHTCDFPKHPQNWCPSCTFVKPGKRQFSYPYCFQCYCVNFPDAVIPRKFKLKENHVVDELKKYFPEVKMVFDKQIDGGCSRRRPDVRIECLTHTIVVECDENAHKGYSCENKRAMEIFQDLGSRPIVFIRFNPDKFEGKVCFPITKGVCSINKEEWNLRVGLLVETIKIYLPLQEKNVHTVHLFYD